MAKVENPTRKRIDLILTQALAAYEELPGVVREIRAWTDAERMSYVHDWFLLEQRITEVESNSARMNQEQLDRLEELRAIVRTRSDDAEFVKSLAA